MADVTRVSSLTDAGSRPRLAARARALLDVYGAGRSLVISSRTGRGVPELRAALRKLVRALPEPLRDRAEAAADAAV